jgi:hypothetical protein
LKARRIPLGLLYVAILILVVIMIPLAQSARRQPINHRQSTVLGSAQSDEDVERRRYNDAGYGTFTRRWRERPTITGPAVTEAAGPNV